MQANLDADAIEFFRIACFGHALELISASALQDCMSFGKPMLIENIEEELDPMLDPVLEKRLIKKGKSFIMPMADKEVRPRICQHAAE